MIHRPRSLACAIGVVLAVVAVANWPPSASVTEAADKDKDKSKPFPVHVVIDVRWEESRECTHTDNPKFQCGGCKTEGSFHADASGVLLKNPDGLLFEPLKNPGGAKVQFTSRDFCPIDGESGHEQSTGDNTVQLLAATRSATQMANPKNGFIMMIHQPWGTGSQVMGEDITRTNISPQEFLAHRGEWEYNLQFTIPFETKDAQDVQYLKSTHLSLVANLRPEKMTGSMGWDFMGNCHGSQPHLNILVVDTDVGRGHLPNGPDSDYDKSKIHVNIGWQIGESLFKTTLVKPAKDKNYVFGEEETDNCVIKAEAKADPVSFEEQITPWSIATVEGSEREIKKLKGGKEVDEKPVKGPQVLFRFKNLPAKNDSFGKKTITAKDADPVDVKLFFRKKGHDNPGDTRQVNWYYYWKQGVVPELNRFTYNEGLNLAGQFTEPDTLEMGRYGGDTDGPYDLRLTLRRRTSKEDVADIGFRHPGTPTFNTSSNRKSARGGAVTIIHIPQTKGIDTCHASVVHELFHKWIYDNWVSNAEPDRDLDGIPDWAEKMYEGSLGLDYENPDTHDMVHQLGSAQYATYGDAELLCRLKELGLHLDGQNDWSSPGKQSDPPE
jgi:hypothetical protein